MSYSATTGKLGLPQWVKGTKDHPDFLTDMNQAFEKIDRFAERTDNTVDGLPEQVDELAALVESMQADVGEHTTELASLGVRVGIQENNVANLGVRVGNLATRVGGLEERLQELEYMDIVVPAFTATLTNRDGDEVEIGMSRHGLYISAWLSQRQLTQFTANTSKYWRLSRETFNMLRIPEGYTLMEISAGLATENGNPDLLYRFVYTEPADYSDVTFGMHIVVASAGTALQSFSPCTARLIKEVPHETTCN